MTLKNVAVISGCSVSTVSKVFSNSAEISEETKQKVLQVASETGYFEKAAKHKPVLGAMKSIVILCKNPSEQFVNLFSAFSKKAMNNGYCLLATIGDEKEASLIMDQMGALGAVILTDKKKQDLKTVKFISSDIAVEGANEMLSKLIDEIESTKPVRIRAKKVGTTETAEPTVQIVAEVPKAKKEEIWLL